jgi:hypothetical protein
MRKRHQALLVSSQAKKKICNELSINNSSYEVEQKQILSNYFNNHIDEEDIEVTSAPKKPDDKYLIKEKENIEEEDEENELDDKDDDDDDEEENVTLSTDIRVPPLADQKGPYIKYEISEKAFVGGVNFDDYSYIPENKLKIKENIDDNDKKKAKTNKKNVKDKKEENNDEGNNILKVGANINFNNIIEQMAYWAEEISYEKSKDKNKNKRKIKDVEIPDINILQLFKLYPNKIDEISNKIKSLEKEAKDKNLYTDNSLVKTLLNDQENIINEKKQSLGKLAKEVDRIHSITYGDNFSVIEFK